MVTKHIRNGIFETYIRLGQKTPFKDINDSNDIREANEKIIKDATAHLTELIDFIKTLRIETRINLDDYIPNWKRRELGLK